MRERQFQRVWGVLTLSVSGEVLEVTTETDEGDVRMGDMPLSKARPGAKVKLTPAGTVALTPEEAAWAQEG